MAEDQKGFEGQIEDFYSKMLSAIGKTTDDEIADMLKKQKKTIAVAESLTGGLISYRLTAVPGSSEFFIGGIVCYTNRVKVMDLGISASLIATMGPVSSEVAVAMAENIRKRYKTEIGLAATGVAGPTTVTPPKPIGLTYIGLSSDRGSTSKEVRLFGTRKEIREKASQAALGVLWLHLTGQDDSEFAVNA